MSRVRTVVSWGICAAVMALLTGCGSETVGFDDPPTPWPYDTWDPPKTPQPTKPTPPKPRNPNDSPPKDSPPNEPPKPTDPPTKPGCESPSTFFADADGDGFGDDATTVTACEAPAGFVAIGGDCMDSNADVHPSQNAFFTTDRGDGSFDYDCDGTEAKERTREDVNICICGLSPWASGCGRTEGWAGPVPACGQPSAFNNAKRGPNVQTCDPDVSIVVQGCR